jgi:hypothetical protein
MNHLHQQKTSVSVPHTYSYKHFGVQNAIVGLASMTNFMMNAHNGRPLKTLNLQNKSNTENRTRRITTVLHINKTDCVTAMATTRNLITHMIVKTTRTNAPAMITADHFHEIAPTLRRAALVITTEMDHRSMMTRRNTRNK